MIEFLCKTLLDFDNILTITSLVLCGLIGMNSVGMGVMKIQKVLKKSGKQKMHFPDYVSYEGKYYKRDKFININGFFPIYLSIYAAYTTVAAITEKIVEGEIGLLAQMNLWEIVGVLISGAVFSFLGGIIGSFVGAGYFYYRQASSGFAATILAWIEIGAMFGAILGAWGAIFFVAFLFSNCYELSLWRTGFASVVTVLITFIDIGRVVYSNQEQKNFEDDLLNTYGSITTIISVEENFKSSNPLPMMVKPLTKEEYCKSRKK